MALELRFEPVGQPVISAGSVKSRGFAQCVRARLGVGFDLCELRAYLPRLRPRAPDCRALEKLETVRAAARHSFPTADVERHAWEWEE